MRRPDLGTVVLGCLNTPLKGSRLCADCYEHAARGGSSALAGAVERPSVDEISGDLCVAIDEEEGA